MKIRRDRERERENEFNGFSEVGATEGDSDGDVRYV